MDSIKLASDSRTPPTSAERLRQQAVALRRAGRSRREIKEILGIGSNATLDRALRGEPPPEWTRRPRAKDDLHARARVLREQGLDYEEIAAALGVSKSSVSLWVRDMPVPARLSYEECRKRSAEGSRLYWETERPAREAQREAVRAAAADQIGVLSKREILIAGAIAYWCEGTKSKPHRRQDCVVFINSDPGLIKFMLHFLAAAGVAVRPDYASGFTSTRPLTWPPPSSTGRTSRTPIRQPSTGPYSSITTRRPSARTWMRITTDACDRMSCRAQICTDRIEGWVRAAVRIAHEPRRPVDSVAQEDRPWVRSRTHSLLPGKDSNLR